MLFLFPLENPETKKGVLLQHPFFKRIKSYEALKAEDN